MAVAGAAIRYAKALLSLAIDQKSAEAVNKDMMLYAKTIAQSEELTNFIKNPTISDTIVKSALLEVFKGSNALSVKLFDVLEENSRFELIQRIALQYTQLYNEHQGLQFATVTTAVPLTKELTAKVIAKVKALTGKEAELENIIDETILGGFILRIGDIQYNASIANKLSKLKREFTLN